MTPDPRDLAVIGDVHGDARRLEKALTAAVGLVSEIVLVGDYVNRGADSREVLELLVNAKADLGSRLTLLRGNHDQVLLDFLAGDSLGRLSRYGGIATIRSYLGEVSDDPEAQFRAEFPNEHCKLLQATTTHWESDDLFISHAGFDPANPASRSAESLLLTSHPDLFTHPGPWPKPLVIAGHYVQSNGRPLVSEHLICIDTGCGASVGAPLTVALLPKFEYRQF